MRRTVQIFKPIVMGCGWLIVVILIATSIGGVIIWRHDKLHLLSVQTGSMKPTIQPGDLVIVKPLPLVEVRLGEVVSYVSPLNHAVVITHRIVRVDRITGMITTKGDNAVRADPPFSANFLVGQVSHDVPYLGHVLDLLRRPVGLMMFVYLPALIIVGLELDRLNHHYARRHYHTERITPLPRNWLAGRLPAAWYQQA